MKLSYRSIHSPTLEVTESEICGKYRGQNSDLPYVRHIPEPPLERNRMYREVAYCSGKSTPAQPALVAQAFARIAEKKFLTGQSTQKFLDDQATATHLMNIRRSLEHRMDVARANGNQSLLRQLEVESKQMAF